MLYLGAGAGQLCEPERGFGSGCGTAILLPRFAGSGQVLGRGRHGRGAAVSRNIKGGAHSR